MKRSKSSKHKKKEKPQQINPLASKRALTRKDLILISVVALISLLLNVLGFGWGMDGRVPWSADAIEGITTVREMPKLFGKWTYKYPRLQFLIDGLCYKPLIRKWEKDPVYTPQNGQQRAQALTLSRLNTLAAVSRINILWMATLTIIFVYLIAKFYYADSIAAFFSSLSLAACFVFVYYSHTSCVDIPSMLWITTGVYFLLVSVYRDKLYCHILSAVFFAFACCTKDAMLFYALAFAVVYVAMRMHRLYLEEKSFKKCIPWILNKNTMLAVIVFLFIFALLQGILASPKDYWDRMSVWVGGRGVKDFNQNFKGQWPLLVKTLKMFYNSVGWPLLGLLIISLVFTKPKNRLFNFIFVLFPLIFFYVLVSIRIKMTFIRYCLPVMGILFLPVGVFVSELFSSQKKYVRRISVFVISILFTLSLLFCIALDLEMINDPRTQTAEWFNANVSKNTTVISLIRGWYGPKLQKHDYHVVLNWKVPPLHILLDNIDSLPDYIILTQGRWYTTKSKEAWDFHQALLNGDTGFSEIAQFRSRHFLNPQKNAMAIACWPLKPHLGIGFPIIVMKKEASD